MSDEQIPFFRKNRAGLSEFAQKIKMGFSHFYKSHHIPRGSFRGDRFKSVIVEKDETLINCRVQIDRNPARASLV